MFFCYFFCVKEQSIFLFLSVVVRVPSGDIMLPTSAYGCQHITCNFGYGGCEVEVIMTKKPETQNEKIAELLYKKTSHFSSHLYLKKAYFFGFLLSFLLNKMLYKIL